MVAGTRPMISAGGRVIPLQSLNGWISVCGVKSLLHAFGIGAALSLSSVFAAGVFFLDELDPAGIEQGHGVARIGCCVDGEPILMGGKVYAKGIGTHSVGLIEMNMDGKADEFSAVVGGSDRMMGKYCGFEFIVQGDGKPLWSSGVMTSDSPPQSVSVKLAGVKKLMLRVEDGGNGISNDHANWADASIRYSGDTPKPGKTRVNLTTEALAVSCFIDKNGVLTVESLGAPDGSGNRPWPVRSIRDPAIANTMTRPSASAAGMVIPASS